jgi:hypothetical protein
LHVQVFRAQCASGTLDGSEVAIKMVNSTDDAALRHVLRESLAHEWLVCEQLGVHPNLMTMHDRLVIDRAQGEPPTVVLVMPLLGAGWSECRRLAYMPTAAHPAGAFRSRREQAAHNTGPVLQAAGAAA